MKNYIHSEKGANISIIKINSHHCYLCGDQFDLKDKKKTMHHAIPDEFNPQRNFLIPVCLACHKLIHNGKSLVPQEKLKLKKIVHGMKNQYDALNSKFENMMSELENKNMIEIKNG